MTHDNDVKAKVNRIPPSTVKRSPKRRGSARKELPRQKRRKPSEPEFRKLDPNDPVEANRIQQRRKAIAKGKNTVGYDFYLNQIPKEKRRPRSMETPATPDHTLDIPGKRWNGLVRAWRVALHRYDPPDLVNSFNKASGDDSKEEEKVEKSNTDVVMMKTPEQTKGMMVDMQQEQPTMTTTDAVDDTSPISVLSEESGRRRQLDQEFAQTNIRWGDMSDSDDDDDDDLL